jgi:hypothetical protein
MFLFSSYKEIQQQIPFIAIFFIQILNTVEFLQSSIHRIRWKLDYKIFRIPEQYLYWPNVRQILFRYCFYTWAAQATRGVFQLDISFSSLFWAIGVPFYFFLESLQFPSAMLKYQKTGSQVIIAEEAHGVGDKESGDNSVVNLEPLWGLVTNFLNCQKIRISCISASRLKEFYSTNLYTPQCNSMWSMYHK